MILQIIEREFESDFKTVVKKTIIVQFKRFQKLAMMSDCSDWLFGDQDLYSQPMEIKDPYLKR